MCCICGWALNKSALQTTARVWDALLNEGPKILFRVGLALMRIHEESLLAQDNPGTLLREMRRAAQAMHDRDKLMKVSTFAAAVRNLTARVQHHEVLIGTQWQQLQPVAVRGGRGQPCYLTVPVPCSMLTAQAAMQVAFDGLGSMPMARIDNFRQIKQEVVDDEMRKRANRCPPPVLHRSSLAGHT